MASASCWVIPVIGNKQGNWVDSILYKDLLEITNNDRQRANQIYEYVHSDEFISKFGDWINLEVENTDSNGEPLVGSIDINSIPTVSTSVLKEVITAKEVLQDKPKVGVTEPEKTLISDLSVMDKTVQIKNKMIKALETRYELSRRYKNVSKERLQEQEKFIKKINELETDKALIAFTRRAIASTNDIYEKWKAIKPQVDQAISEGKSIKEVIKPGLLYIWKDYLTTFDSVNDLSNYLLKEGKLDNRPQLKEALSKVITTKDSIKSLYEEYGLPILAEELSPFYNKVFRDFEVSVGSNYESLPESEKGKYTKEQFVEAQKELNREDLRQQTINLFKAELQTAGKDISMLTRWFSSGLETSDPIFASLAKKLQYLELERRSTQIIPTKNKLVDNLRKLEKYSKASNFKELYDSLLEKDEKGNYTGKEIDRFGSKFWEAYSDFRAEVENNDKLDEDTKTREIKAWVRVNAPLRQEEFNSAKWANIDQLHKDGTISDQEYVELEWNEGSKSFLSYMELKERGILSQENAILLSDWVHDNIWDYRDPSDKWYTINKSYRDFIRLPKSDPRVQMYELLKEIKYEANRLLPESMRLQHGDLPNILQSNEEKFKSGDITGALKNVFAKQFNVLIDDNTRGNEPLEDEQGNKRYFVPIYYTGKTNKKVKNPDGTESWVYDPTEQSYDLAGIYYRFFDMATNFAIRTQMLPEVEMAKYFVKQRDILEIDKKGNVVKKKKGVVTEGVPKTKSKGENLLADQLEDWIKDNFYGIKEESMGEVNILGLKVDKSKALKWLAKYTGLNIMALNFKTAVSNVIMGEAQQVGESFAKQHMSLKSYTKARWFYDKNLVGIIGDIGSRKPTNIITLLNEQFGITMESLDPKFKDTTVVKQLAKTSSLYFMLRSGDHWMKNRFFLGMLEEKKAYDSNGKELGSILSQYYVENGKLKLKKEVDLEKSKWTTKDQYDFTIKVQSILSSIHQEISPLGRAAAERHAIGALALLFRKFIAPGVARRYKKLSYVERQGDYTEGYYRTTGRFFSKLFSEFKTYKFAVMSEEWDKLSPMEKANIRRTLNDIVFFTLAFILAGMFIKLGDDDDDEWIYHFAAYQMLRFQTEVLFFTPKLDETMTILRSPFASMSLLENIIKLTGQVFHPTERYIRGPWKGHLKMEKIMWDFLPVMRSFYQTRDIKQQMGFFDR